MTQFTTQQVFEMATRHHQSGRLREAEQLYRQILDQQPNHAGAMNHLGVIALQVGRNDVAVDLIGRAITASPNYAEAHSNLGSALIQKGELPEAIKAYRQAIAINPNYATAHSNLGNALRGVDQLDEAIAACRRAIELRPDLPESHNYLGNALKENGQVDEAIAAYRRAIELRPDFGEAHIGLAAALLVRGDFQEGWQEFEWRSKRHDAAQHGREIAQHGWDGSPLDGRMILLQNQQGFGDAFQFIRYVPMVAQRSGKIVIECRKELERLFNISNQDCQIITPDYPLPNIDVHCDLLSLPRIFGTTLANIPNSVPYLKPDPKDTAKWRQRLSELSPAANVGLVWAGDPTNPINRRRTMNLEMLDPLARIPDIRFISLQKGSAAAQTKSPPLGMDLIDWTDELKDFAETAALIENLDLIISVETSVAHLAGAMNKPIWTLLSFVPDFRWLEGREDTPWYPSMRLFRQQARGDWQAVIARVFDALSLWMKDRA